MCVCVCVCVCVWRILHVVEGKVFYDSYNMPFLNGIYIRALMNNLLDNTNKRTSIKNIHFHIQSTNTPKCFDLLQSIFRKSFIEQTCEVLKICGYHKIPRIL